MGAMSDRTEAPFDADERTMLCAFLDFHRATLVWKVEGLGDDELHRVPIPSSTLTLGGLVKHLALVEDSWFTQRFAGSDEPEPWASAPFDDDPDWEFHSSADDSLETLLALYRAACDRSRAVVDAAASLDQVSTAPDRRTGHLFTLRWILLHMIEETARHNGHADLLREAIDGATGE
jgi:uncharacterized damage-inducible protein DinB